MPAESAADSCAVCRQFVSAEMSAAVFVVKLKVFKTLRAVTYLQSLVVD